MTNTAIYNNTIPINPDLIPINSVIEKYKVCKICGAENVFIFNKLKE